MSQPTPKRRRRVARAWHRWLGVIAALPLLWLSVSGLLLNHAESLGLNEKEVSAEWVLKRYHQIPEGDPRGLQVGDRLVADWGGLIFLDDDYLEVSGKLVGAVALKNQLAIVTDERIALIDGSGQMVLELDELSLPELPLEAVTVEDQRLVVQSKDGVWLFSDDLLSFEKGITSSAVSPLQLLGDEERETLSAAIRSRNAMPLSRVILDAHSGKLFGWPGWVITDLAAVSVVVLTLFGLRLFPKRRS